ncbi:hypothetical protein [Bacillus chungangensis]|uniref:Spore coat protein n=1 Tax=Bacillus chungangensis TaxID=587633 RepID=A0ABT9WWM3_9BACI|nr:hypothetical protein [Bacillus chungangensis]MDQ0177699.1 hypothetical protein [Bacillus chungangensis]
MNYYYRTAPYRNPFFFGVPLLAGFAGGILGSALWRPRPVIAYPPPVPYGGVPPYGFSPYGGAPFGGAPYGW